MPTYILQKDTHMTKAKTEFKKFIVNDITNEQYYKNDFSIEIVPASVVENNPLWFLQKKEESISYYTIRIEYTKKSNFPYNGVSVGECLHEKITPDKYEAIKEAIERVLNNEDELKGAWDAVGSFLKK